MDLIEERQLNVEATLSLVLEQRDTDGLNLIQRYYELEQTDEEFRKYWHSDFVMKLGKKADGYDVQHFAVLANIDDMLRFELVQTLFRVSASSGARTAVCCLSPPDGLTRCTATLLQMEKNTPAKKSVPTDKQKKKSPKTRCFRSTQGLSATE